MVLSHKSLVVDARLIKASGIGTDIQNLLPYLKDHYKITLLGDPEELSKYPWTSDLRVIKFTKPIYSIAEQLFLPMLIPSCDYFLSPHFNIPALPVRAAKRLVIIHDVFHLAAPNVNLFHKLYAKFLLQSAISLSNSIITISEFSRSEIIRFLNVGNKEVYKISLGVDHQRYKQTHRTSLVKEVIISYSLPSDFILFVGNVKPHKNLRNLVLAFSKLTEPQFSNLKLLIVGKKEGFITGDTSLMHLIEELGLLHKVIFTGFVENEHLPVIYTLATLFVFPSLYEGFGLPPLEAMASGCPTIVSETASMPEICKDACCYIDGKNPDDIANAVKRVLTDTVLENMLIAKGLKLAQEYKWEKAASELRSIIEDIK